MSDDGFLHFCHEPSNPTQVDDYWKILIVDDDKFIHQVTQLVLKNAIIEDKGILLLNAYTANQAKVIFQQQPDIALAFIDVVMETNSAGLELIRWVRQTLNNPVTRLVLRTGQTSNVPKEDIIKGYDIHDYKQKSELTAHKLTATVYSAIRCYRDIMYAQNQQSKFNQLIKSIPLVLSPKSLPDFTQMALIQLLDLLAIKSPVLHIIKKPKGNETLLGHTGQFSNIYQISQLPPALYTQIKQLIKSPENNPLPQYHVIFKQTFPTQSVMIIQQNTALNKLQISSLSDYTNAIAILLNAQL
ncbi:DUF3369 domain-containing protein [Catenovulum adriaticum]|uniref:DUF3369 domain-containing protein n=1 Tax=Catenovulum adriaticum TaxID=2984846 RepID=A0ABY7AJ02_9ALTE|nr:DUF3369 domain-containing protein [Catenovulum sp. TS8]WAJ69300.1 DUF3369 domain-containing protein [Catenovulum sp. TS8]